MKHLMILVMLLALLACQTLKQKYKSKLNLDSSIIDQTNLKRVQRYQQLQWQDRSDSSHAKFQMRLYPRGQFSFSTDSGFKGEAWLMEIAGTLDRKQKTSAAMAASSTATTDSVVNKQLKLKKRQTSVAVLRKSLNPWWLLLLIPFGLCLCYKKSDKQ